VTGPAAGTWAGAYDVDGGRTTIESPAIELPARAGQRLAFRYYLAHDAASSSADELRVQVVAAGGAATTVLLERGAANDDDAAWASASVLLDPWAGTTVRIRISATDAGSWSLVEAAIDDVRVTRS
jgi:aminopeptidase S